MSKVYVLRKRIKIKHRQNARPILGVVRREEIAILFESLSKDHSYLPFELDDPELLNRIAKESEKEKLNVT